MVSQLALPPCHEIDRLYPTAPNPQFALQYTPSGYGGDHTLDEGANAQRTRQFNLGVTTALGCRTRQPRERLAGWHSRLATSLILATPPTAVGLPASLAWGWLPPPRPPRGRAIGLARLPRDFGPRWPRAPAQILSYIYFTTRIAPYHNYKDCKPLLAPS